ncbi:hypothetical protein Dpoa2040_003411 [Dickeya sp. CFBP 2040]|uniref:Uncharacterized protein n=1 Tax=Dickeya poaceiphila TaxID=568768 RepID=A0A5B8IAD5_9GAMM|nr:MULTISPECIES: hypothetical protein [Dickeya]NKI76074.1 hypothetical protein [Dickeya sp. CFBP 2040]QDX31552.1 hypothetical protein Dpoa569_0003599 [Dickeya poaceiphila]
MSVIKTQAKNIRTLPTHKFKPNLIERIAIAEALSYEYLSLLPLANTLISKEISISWKEVIIFMGDDNINFTIKNIGKYKVEGVITSSHGYFDEISSSTEKRKITLHRLPLNKKISYKKNSNVWCFCLPGKMYNSKLDIYGKWRDGLYEHLNRIMTGFLHTRKATVF